jgi:hypothetical protein
MKYVLMEYSNKRSFPRVYTENLAELNDHIDKYEGCYILGDFKQNEEPDKDFEYRVIYQGKNHPQPQVIYWTNDLAKAREISDAVPKLDSWVQKTTITLNGISWDPCAKSPFRIANEPQHPVYSNKNSTERMPLPYYRCLLRFTTKDGYKGVGVYDSIENILKANMALDIPWNRTFSSAYHVYINEYEKPYVGKDQEYSTGNLKYTPPMGKLWEWSDMESWQQVKEPVGGYTREFLSSIDVDYE